MIMIMLEIKFSTQTATCYKPVSILFKTQLNWWNGCIN